MKKKFAETLISFEKRKEEKVRDNETERVSKGESKICTNRVRENKIETQRDS